MWGCPFLIKTHELYFVSVDIEAYAICCPFQTMQQGIGLVGCICQKRYVVSVVHVCNCSSGYLLLLTFAKVLSLNLQTFKACSLDKINRYEANASPCSIPATMSKKSVSPSIDRTFTFVFLHSIIMAATVSFGRGTLARSICSIFPLFSIHRGRSLQIIVSPRGFLHKHLPIFDV